MTCQVADEAVDLIQHEEQTIDLSNWMTNLHDDLTHVPVNQLAIPGSHDSGAFWLDPHSPVCPDEPSTIRNLVKVFGSCAKHIVIKWSTTQKLIISEQLEHGIRYFDMRNGYLSSEDDVFFVHGVYGHKIDDLLRAIQVFLRTHPKEVVVVDFNHFYSMTDSIHSRLAKSISSIFDGMIFPANSNGIRFTLNDMREVGKQVVIVYDNSTVCQKYTKFWPSTAIFSPWPNTSSVTKLIDSLHKRFDSLRADSFNIFQAILTPQTITIAAHVFSSLEKCLAKKCDKAVAEWLANVYTSKQLGVNIVICDFISLDICSLDIIKLNDLLINDKK